MCQEGSKKGFVAECRPFIGVDGYPLKTKYSGQLLIVVGRDPNDQYFPLAFAIVETETKKSWRWFLTLLLEDIGEDNPRCLSQTSRRYISLFPINYRSTFIYVGPLNL